MSVDQLQPGNARPAQRDAPARQDTQFVRYDEYIDKQIQATRRSVKTVDIMTALLVMVTGTLGFLLIAAIVEHWLVPGGFNLAVRLLLFVALFGGLAFFTTRRLWPLIAGSINPAYAAHAIEHENPSLKNSLLNLLLFRERRDDITDAVYETLEEQAAKRLNRVPIESAVDRTQLLRLGYVLIGILAAVALYKIFSPKDPFISAERVLMPWARIVPASRVSIENVEPGVVTVARGDVLTVSADIRGTSDDDPVVVRYTTADGQAVDRPAPMTPSSAGLRFTGQIPPATDGAKAGVAQNLRYRIEAGDARSLEYAVTVVAAPTITIERIDYDYPDYTLYVDRSVERLGDIRAIEGTRVTIHARANEPIEDAAIDFEADGRRDVRLTPAGSDAEATFTLELRDDRQTPKFTSYVLRFTGTSGRPNRNPVKFPIDVMPDHGPEVSILAPAEKMRDVRVDETVAIEVDAIDPDFALAEVRLQGEAAGNRVLGEKLLAQEHTGRFTGRHLFTPHEHDLKPGDVVRYWVTARDNRTPQPNEVSSDSQTLRIVGPNAKQPGQPPQVPTAKRDPQQGGESKEGQQQEGEGGQSGGQSSSSSAGDQQGESGSNSGQQEQTADGQSNQSGEQDSANQSGDGNSAKNQSGEQSNDQSKPSQSGESQSGESQSGESNSGNNSGGKGKPSAGNESSVGEKGNESAGEPASADGNQTKPGNNGKPSDANQDPSQQPGANESGKPASADGNQPQPGNNGDPKSGAEPSPVSSEGDNDGEAFERIQDFLKREGKLPKESESKDPGESASADGQKGNTSESAKPNSEGNQSESNADSKSEQNQQGEPASAGGKEPQPSDSSDPSQQNSADKSESGDPSDEVSSDESSPENNQDSKSPDGQHTSSEGESGAGKQPPEQSTGSPESPTDSQPGDKWQQKPSGDQPGDQKGDQPEPPSGGQGKKKNDSQGNEGGDRSGGGEEGAGQKSERDGTGSAGQNQSADEGAGESSEQGAGENSPNAGQDAKSDKPTGQPGSQEKGDGSGQREGQGEQPGGAQDQNASDQSAGQQKQNPNGEPASGSRENTGGEKSQAPNNDANSPNQENATPQQPNPAESQPNQSNPNSPEQNSQQPNAKQPSPLSQDSNSNSSTADGAGRVPNGTMQPSQSTGDAPAADAANLEYARKQTDLVLETLAEQMKRKQVDKKLLDKLGWSEADLKRFLDRWQQLKAAADDNSPVADEAQRELDDALRSLGLRRGQLGESKTSDDTNRNLRQGYRGPVPLEYQERLRAYNQGVSRARQSEE